MLITEFKYPKSIRSVESYDVFRFASINYHLIFFAHSFSLPLKRTPLHQNTNTFTGKCCLRFSVKHWIATRKDLKINIVCKRGFFSVLKSEEKVCDCKVLKCFLQLHSLNYKLLKVFRHLLLF